MGDNISIKENNFTAVVSNMTPTVTITEDMQNPNASLTTLSLESDQVSVSTEENTVEVVIS